MAYLSFDLEGESQIYSSPSKPLPLYHQYPKVAISSSSYRSGTNTTMSQFSDSHTYFDNSSGEYGRALQELLDNHWLGNARKPTLKSWHPSSTPTPDCNTASGRSRHSLNSGFPSQSSRQANTSPEYSIQNFDSQTPSHKTICEPGTSIVDEYTRPQSLVLAINFPDTDISLLAKSDQKVVRSCWEEKSLPDDVETCETLGDRANPASALLQAACRGKASRTKPLSQSLLPWVEVVGTDHMWRLMNCEKGTEAGVLERTKPVCSRIVGSVL